MDCIMSGFHWVGDAIQPSHSLSSPSPAFTLSQLISGSFLMSWLFSSGGWSIGASASVLLMSIQDWFPLGLDWFDLVVQETLKSLLQHHSLKASVHRHSAFFMVHLSHPYLTTRKTIAFTIWNFVSEVMSLFFNMQSRFVKMFLPRSRHLLISWLQSPSVAILGKDCG